jgi:hypothetical protein
MRSRHTLNKDEAKPKLRDLILVFECVPHDDIRSTDLAPIIVPEHESFTCRAMRWGWRGPWDKIAADQRHALNGVSLPRRRENDCRSGKTKPPARDSGRAV